MHGFRDCLWVLPWMPSCVICGLLIESDTRARFFWAHVPNFELTQVRHITLPVTDIHPMISSRNCRWQSMYRASKSCSLGYFEQSILQYGSHQYISPIHYG